MVMHRNTFSSNPQRSDHPDKIELQGTTIQQCMGDWESGSFRTNIYYFNSIRNFRLRRLVQKYISHKKVKCTAFLLKPISPFLGK